MSRLGTTGDRTLRHVIVGSKCSTPAYAAVLVLCGVVLVGSLARPAHAQTVPPCDLAGDVIVELFDGTALRSDLDEFAATNGPFEVDPGGGLPDGYYSVHLQSFDRHSTDAMSEDPMESWYIEGFGPDGSLAWTSEPIPDVPEDRDLFAATVTEGSAIPALTAVRAVHAAYPDSTSTNSVHALCVAFIAEVEPTTTTTAAGDSDPDTTGPSSTEPTEDESGALAPGAATPTDPDGVGPDDGAAAGGRDNPDVSVAGEQVSDSDTNVLGAQVESPVLPFTGPSDGQWAALGSGLAVLGSLFIAAMRDDDPWHTLERSW